MYMEQYKEGTVFEMYEGDDKDYVVLKKTNIENKIYLVVAPLKNKEDNSKIDPTGLLVINVDEQTDDIEFVKDEKIVRQVIDSVLAE